MDHTIKLKNLPKKGFIRLIDDKKTWTLFMKGFTKSLRLNADINTTDHPFYKVTLRITSIDEFRKPDKSNFIFGKDEKEKEMKEMQDYLYFSLEKEGVFFLKGQVLFGKESLPITVMYYHHELLRKMSVYFISK